MKKILSHAAYFVVSIAAVWVLSHFGVFESNTVIGERDYLRRQQWACDAYNEHVQMFCEIQSPDNLKRICP